jgi:pyruvate dehydrogenase E1 component alpha subunit
VSVADGSAPASALRSWLEGEAEGKALGLLRLLEESGAPTALIEGADPELVDSQPLARRLLEGMLRIRVIDGRMLKLQRQGRIGFYGAATGQEASVVGTAAAMEPQDWLVPALREAGAGLFRGLPLADYVAQILGNVNDVTRGRQMPCHPSDPAHNYVCMSSCIGGQLIHAVGIAHAMKLRGDPAVCFGYVGDGGTSTGDFHAAMNFAGVAKLPVVIVCQNNQWAISTPGERQTAAETIALKGVGYGIESLRVDGNDALAVFAASRYARERAARGEGPVFLELLTFRVGAHSTSDDPSRYRDERVTAIWRDERDPIARLEAWMTARGWLEPGESDALRDGYEREILDVVNRQEGAPPPERATLFDDVFEQPTWLLREQAEEA